MRFSLRLASNVVLYSLFHVSTIVEAAFSNNALSTCNDLQTRLGSKIVQLSSGAEYLAGATNAWDLFNTVQRPSCIIFPRNSSHVQTAMAGIFRDQVRYAVQAGSHSAMKGWNNVQDGVLIFFSHMKNISFDATTDTITLQPGIHWGEALNTLEPLGVAPMGGRITDVGTGLLLGGGYSYLASEHGFSVDALKEADVVLVTGKLVTATATNKYSDLFRALKGGANRFGIVTRYVVSAIHTGTNQDKNWFGGIVMYPNSSVEAVVNATANYVRNTKDPKTGLLVVLANVVVDSVLTASHVVTMFYRGSTLPSSIFGEFLSIPSTVQLLGPKSYIEVASSLGDGADRGILSLFGASARKGGPEQFLDAFRHWTNYTIAVQGSVNTSIMAFTPILDTQIVASRASGGNVINPPRGSYAAIQLETQLSPGVLEVPVDIERGRQLLFKQIPPSPGLPLYINECDASQNVYKTYGDFEFLKRTYMKYDPTRFIIRFSEGPIGL
ncbi:hypothetical protein BDQ12DRAFT_707669 [Crucibulum laeve]|uniref:FAD-binding PCMH-type domain-containing protein n=1 Tax=Crucibulum laeve TaxID=68775 RepID=A0A5C3LUE7_9AGAR|nr:hypothetical protein BDQ12DRAFT_707669 [Crucibulum laeve]